MTKFGSILLTNWSTHQIGQQMPSQAAWQASGSASRGVEEDVAPHTRRDSCSCTGGPCWLVGLTSCWFVGLWVGEVVGLLVGVVGTRWLEAVVGLLVGLAVVG